MALNIPWRLACRLLIGLCGIFGEAANYHLLFDDSKTQSGLKSQFTSGEQKKLKGLTLNSLL